MGASSPGSGGGSYGDGVAVSPGARSTRQAGGRTTSRPPALSDPSRRPAPPAAGAQRPLEQLDAPARPHDSRFDFDLAHGHGVEDLEREPRDHHLGPPLAALRHAPDEGP